MTTVQSHVHVLYVGVGCRSILPSNLELLRPRLGGSGLSLKSRGVGMGSRGQL